MQRPLYMRPRDALEYGIIDEVIQPNAEKQVRQRDRLNKAVLANRTDRKECREEEAGGKARAVILAHRPPSVFAAFYSVKQLTL